jgi:hypothetical protein
MQYLSDTLTPKDLNVATTDLFNFGVCDSGPNEIQVMIEPVVCSLFI